MAQRPETRLWYLSLTDVIACWRFGVTAISMGFHHALEELLRTESFKLREAQTYKGRPTYLINDEGMWLLSHCFTNWEEAFAQVVQSPSKVFEASPPPFPGGKVCAECGNVFRDWRYGVRCEECGESFHKSVCYQAHRATCERLKQKRAGHAKGPPFGDGFTFKINYDTPPQWSSTASTAQRDEDAPSADWAEIINCRFFSSQQSQATKPPPPPPPPPPVPREGRDAFTSLGLSGRPTKAQVKRAYRALAKETHPDAGGSNQAMAKLNAVYAVALNYAKDE